jgi:Ser/Thr protein kinase RdoA (MazF antagonist)
MPPRPPEIESIAEALARIVGVPVSIDALPSGTTGLSYRVETAQGSYVAKVFHAHSEALLGPAEQYKLMRVLAEAEVSPQPVGFDADARLLVTEFLGDAVPLEPDTLQKPENIEKTARCLRRLHAITAAIPRFAPEAYARRYVDKAGGPMSLTGADRDRYAELLELAPMLDGLAVSVCHNDLLAENLLVDGDVRLIDFDYAVMAPPVVDLASLIVMNGLSGLEGRGLLDVYYGGPAPIPAAEFARVQRLVRLVAHFWALASGDTQAAIVAQYRIEDG